MFQGSRGEFGAAFDDVTELRLVARDHLGNTSELPLSPLKTAFMIRNKSFSQGNDDSITWDK